MPTPLRLTGLVAAPYTPFHADCSLNPSAIAPMAELLIGAGVSGVFICGSTGEGHSLSVDERQMVAEAWVRAVERRIPVVVHVGHNSLFDAITLARHAEGIGVDAIASLAPSYYKPRTMDDLIAFLAAVASAAPLLPFYYYHIPSMTGVTLPVPEFLRKGKGRIPNLNGLKFTHNDFMELQECLSLGDEQFDVLFGLDEMLLAGLAFGVKGAVGSTYNFAAPVYLRVIEAFNQGDMDTARREQRKGVELVRVLYDFGLMRAGKSIMGLLGVDCGPVRSPLDPILPDEVRTLHGRLKHLDVFAGALRLGRARKAGSARRGRNVHP
jgi:N-acetylneuraminate lyase